MAGRRIRAFVRCETGAISADWIALTAGIVFLSFLMLMHFAFGDGGPLTTLESWIVEVNTRYFGS